MQAIAPFACLVLARARSRPERGGEVLRGDTGYGRLQYYLWECWAWLRWTRVVKASAGCRQRGARHRGQLVRQCDDGRVVVVVVCPVCGGVGMGLLSTWALTGLYAARSFALGCHC
jgi:hypothetical protein